MNEERVSELVVVYSYQYVTLYLYVMKKKNLNWRRKESDDEHFDM